MQSQRYALRFPAGDLTRLAQDQAYFLLDEDGRTDRIRLHDYAAIYSHPGLYEQLFYDRLKCSSPIVVTRLLGGAVSTTGGHPSLLRVFDVGAGNGMVGEQLAKHSVARIVGSDIIDEAAVATDRDRPGVYDAYYVFDLTDLPEKTRDELAAWHFNAMTCVAALGFGDMPPRAFASAWNLIAEEGWIAFNIKETFLERHDASGFSALIQRLILDEYLKLHHLERYHHRLSLEGRPLHYYAVVARKLRDIDEACLEGL